MKVNGKVKGQGSRLQKLIELSSPDASSKLGVFPPNFSFARLTNLFSGDIVDG